MHLHTSVAIVALLLSSQNKNCQHMYLTLILKLFCINTTELIIYIVHPKHDLLYAVVCTCMQWHSETLIFLLGILLNYDYMKWESFG